MNTEQSTYSNFAKLIHLGLAGFGIAAFLTGELAEDGATTGYLVHAYLGLSLGAVMLLRLGAGFGHSRCLRFRDWQLFSREQWRQVLRDIQSLVRLQVPEANHHRGLSGLVQALGLMIFAWMAFSGTGLFLMQDSENAGLFQLVEEAHEIGESLIPIYLLLHVAAVILHTLVGKPVWKRMFRFGYR